MSNCTNCFSGCTEIYSDKCIKYTGLAIPELNINNGDTLAAVELAVTNYLVSTLDGSGIYPLVSESIICEVISKYFVACAPCDGLTLNDLLTAMVKAVCDLQEQINDTNATIASIEEPYTLGCLTGVTSNAGTHDILQATITKLCAVDTSLTGVINSLTTFVTAANVNDYIAAYLAEDPTQVLVSNRMVPYSAVPYFGNLDNFDATGAGTGDWVNIYLCNGLNPGVPDLRGRALVAVASGIPGGVFNPDVNPTFPGNPAYEINDIGGKNTITLNNSQIPSHTHSATAISTVDEHGGHLHNYQTRVNNNYAQFSSSEREVTTWGLTTSQTATALTGITVGTTVTVAPFGAGESHPNIQPVYACYYIIYIP
jgi:microcystin-dependent protein